jgi:hypothetical protein
VVAAIHRRRVLPLAERRLPLSEMKPGVPLLPRVMPDSAGAVCLKHACVFRSYQGLNNLLSCYKVAFLFLSFRVSGLVYQ